MFDRDSSSEDSRPTKRRRNIPSFSQNTNTKDSKPTSSNTVQDDSLDAFMTKIQTQASTTSSLQQRKPRSNSHSPDRTYNSTTHGKHIEQISNGDEEDSDSLSPLRQDSKRDLYLQPIDFSKQTSLPNIQWSTYQPLPYLTSMSHLQIENILSSLGATVRSGQGIIPINKFQDLALILPTSLLGFILRKYDTPTSIQRVAIPALLSSKDLMAAATTGSGKTIAYTIPLLVHVAQQFGDSYHGRGPVALILVPVRELAVQTAKVIRSVAQHFSLSVATIVAGVQKYEQFKRVRDGGAQIFVATPGRLIDMLKMRACTLFRVSLVILDEADRMLDMGFESQVRALLSQIRPEAQKALFSATLPGDVRYLSKDLLKDPAHIVIKSDVKEGRKKPRSEKELESGSGDFSPDNDIAMVNGNVTEEYVYFKTELQREQWLLDRLHSLIEEGLVIIFCQSRGSAAALANRIHSDKIPAVCIHGETDHQDRTGLLKMFSTGEVKLMVTTDLSARGLDIANVKNVINYGCAKNWEWHVHRAGRTGRASQYGTAYTLVCSTTRQDLDFVNQAIRIYRRIKATMPHGLAEIPKDVIYKERVGQGARRGRDRKSQYRKHS